MFEILRIIWVMVSLDRSRIWMSGKYSTKFLRVHYGPNSQMTPNWTISRYQQMLFRLAQGSLARQRVCQLRMLHCLFLSSSFYRTLGGLLKIE